jgi:hypothetical protein
MMLRQCSRSIPRQDYRRAGESVLAWHGTDGHAKPNDAPGNSDYPSDDAFPGDRAKEDLAGNDDWIDYGAGGGTSRRTPNPVPKRGQRRAHLYP